MLVALALLLAYPATIDIATADGIGITITTIAAAGEPPTIIAIVAVDGTGVTITTIAAAGGRQASVERQTSPQRRRLANLPKDDGSRRKHTHASLAAFC